MHNNDIAYEIVDGQRTLNLQDLKLAVARIGEVASVTKLKAPELLATFNKAWRDAVEAIKIARTDHVQAERSANRIRAVVLLDRAPKILQDKGLATARAPGGSEDFREAVLSIDEEYQKAVGIVDEIETVIELLKGYQKAVEMAFTSVKKILGDMDTFSYEITTNNLSAGDNNEAGAGDNIYSKFGKARYS